MPLWNPHQVIVRDDDGYLPSMGSHDLLRLGNVALGGDEEVPALIVSNGTTGGTLERLYVMEESQGTWITSIGEDGIQMYGATTTGMGLVGVYDDFIAVGEVTTTDATPTTISTYQYTPSELGLRVLQIEWAIVGYRTSGGSQMGSFRVVASFKSDGSTTLTQVGSTTSLVADTDGSFAVTVSIVSNIATLQVTGGAYTVKWRAHGYVVSRKVS